MRRPDGDLADGRVTLRPMTAEWVDAVHEVLSDPGIEPWWPLHARAEVAAELEEEHVIPFVILVGDEVVGYLSAYEETDPMYRHGGIDLALRGSAQGRGIGTAAIRLALGWLIEGLGHHRVVIDPAADNVRAVHVYEQLGFRTVGRMRRYELGPDGTWRDGLLMEFVIDA